MSGRCAMTYLSGLLHADLFGTPCLGMMMAPGSTKTPPAGMPFALDNGAFGGRYAGDTAFLRWLDSRPHAGCLFAVAPDVVGDAAATLRRSAPMLPRIRALGFPVALAAQNGWDAAAVDWDAFDVLFLGGDDAFKLGAAGKRAAADALAHGKRLHVGRVNSLTRLMYAAGIGAASCDGSTIRFNPGRYVGEIKRWLAAANAPVLPGIGHPPLAAGGREG